MPNNRDGTCLQLKDCFVLKNLANKKQIREADRRFLKRSSCGRIRSKPLVCCPKSENITTRFDGEPLQIDDLPIDCGRLYLNHHDQYNLIIGGNVAKIYDSPWLALLQYEKCMSFVIRYIY